MAKGQAVDQRIVEMKFDNSDFESKVGKTLETLTKLREKTKMEDAGKGMENLAKGVKQVDLSRLADGIEQLNQRFSAFGIMGQQVIRNLTDGIMNLGNQMVSAITQAPKDGWAEYELNLDSVKNILNSAKGKDGLPVTLDLVNEKLAELNRYSDQTIYSFSDMTSNIGKFTNAGVDLESAVTAIQGVANVAALSGANANDAARAMYNFGQALGAGSVKLIDWKSIQNANMATVDFKNQLIQTAAELGVIRKEGDKWISSTYSGKKATEEAFDATSNFEDSLKQEWMTTEVLTKTLAKYTDKTSDLGKAAFEAATKVTSLSKLIDTTKEAMGSGWMNIWQYIFGDYEEASKLWTDVSGEINNVLNSFFDPINGHEDNDGNWIKGILEEWHDRGGREDLIEGFRNLYEAAKHFLDPVKDLLGGLFPKVTADRLLTFTKDFRTFAEKLAEPFKTAKDTAEDIKGAVEKVEEPIEDVVEQAEKFKQIRDEIISGKWGNGQERIDKLKEAGYEYSNLQNAVNETLGATKRYETTMSDAEAVGEQLAESTKDQAEEQKNYREEIKKSNDEIFVHKGAVENIAYIFLGVSSAVKTVVKVVDLAVNSFKKLSGGVGPVAATLGLVLDILGNLGRHIFNFNSGVQEWLNKFNDLGGAIEAAKLRITGFFNTNKDGSKTLGITNDKLEESRHFLMNIVTVLQTVKNKITGFFDTINNKLGDSNFLVDLRIALNELGRYVGGALLMTFNALATVFNRVYGAAKALWAQFKNNDAVTRLVKAYKEAKDAVKGFFETLKNQSPADANGNSNFSKFIVNLNTVLTTLIGVLGKIGTKAFNLLSSGLTKLNELSQKLFGYLANTGVLEKVTTIWEKFKATFKDLPTIVDNFFKSIKSGKIPTLADLSTNLAEFVQKLRELAGQLRDKAGQFVGEAFDNLVGSIAKIGQLQLPESLRNFTQKIAAAFGLFGDTTSSAAKTVGDFIHNVLDKLSGINLKEVALTGLIGSVALFVARWSKVGKNGSKALKALTTFIKNGGKAATDVQEKFSGFLKIAAAIALIAASVWILAQVPAERFWQCVGVLAVAFAALAGVVIYLTKAKMDENRLKGIGIAFAGLGASLVLFAAAVKAFSSMVDDPNFIKGCGLVALAIVSMIAAIKLTGPVSDGAGKAFAGLAAGVLILAVAVKAFAAMSPDTLIKGGIAVEIFMFSMAAAMRVAGNVSADGFMGLAGAVVILAVAVKMLAGLRTDKLVKGEIAVIALVVAMALASRSAKDVDGEAFKAMGKAIKILATAMFVLSKIPTLKLIAVTASLVLIFKSLTEAAKQLKEIKPKESAQIAIALLAMLIPIGACLVLLTKLADPNAVLEVAIGLAAVMWGLSKMGPAIEALSKVDFGSGIKAIGLLDIALASIAALMGALLYILGSINEAGGEKLVNGAHLLGEILHALIEGFIFGDEDPSSILTSIGEGLSNFADKIQAFVTALQGMDGSVAENAKNLATAILAICAAEVLEALSGWIAGKSNFSEFGQAIRSVTEAIMEINEAVSGEGNKFDNRAVKQVISCINGMVEIANALPRQGGLVQKLLGTQDLGEFAKQLSAFVQNGFKEFVTAINGLGDDISAGFVVKVQMVKMATKNLVDLANDLPSSGFSLKSLIFGNQDLGKFASQMATFMSGGFTEFVKQVNALPDFEPSRINTQIVPATEAMINLGKKLKENTSILSFFTGKNDLSAFGSAMASFGAGVKSFMESTAGFQPTNVDALTTSVEKLSKLNADPNLLGLGLTTFAESMVNLGHGLATFIADTASVTTERVSDLVSALANLHNMLLILSATDYSGVSNFTVALEEIIAVAQLVSDTLVDSVIFGIDAKSMDFRVSGSDMANAWAAGFTQDVWVEFFGMALINKVINGINEKVADMKTVGTDMSTAWAKGYVYDPWVEFYGMALINKVIVGIQSKYKDMRSEGGSCALEFCAGLTKKYAGMIRGAGRSVVSQAISGIQDKIGDFKDEGHNAADGFAEGIREYAWKAAKEAADMVRDAINAAKEEQDSASPSKVFRGLGGDGAEGYGLGFTDLIPFVKKSVTKTGNAGILAMRDTIEKMNDMIDDNVDYAPTITPVIDLTQLNNGMNTTRGLLAELNNAKAGINAALDISTAHNESLAKAKERANRNYSGDLQKLVEGLRTLNQTAKQNNVAVIDGDYLFGYMNTRLGAAYSY